MVTSGMSDMYTTEPEFETASDGPNPKLCYLLPWLHCMQLYHVLMDCFYSHFKVTPRPIPLTYKMHSSVRKNVSKFLRLNAGASRGLLIFWVFRSVPFLVLMCLHYLNTCLVFIVSPRRLSYLLHIFSKYKLMSPSPEDMLVTKVICMLLSQ